MKFVVAITLSLLFLETTTVYGQSIAQRRHEIDAKREGVDFTSRDALPRGREFKRIDSTYYVGWMLEGTYKYDHAADYLGFKTASTQLEKAMKLMEKDFKKELKTRTSNVFDFIKIMKLHRDWDYVAYCLMNCYSNTDQVDKLWSLLQTCRKFDLQDEQLMDSYNYLAWTVHRNRFYTTAKYSFLKKNIDENEQLANRYLDSATMKIKRDALLFKPFLTIDYEASKIPGVWHYKSMLYSYQLNIPSGAYYYEKLRSTPYFPHNNYATFCSIQGKFREAVSEYDLAKKEEGQDKRMQESYYYLSIMNAYRARAKEGIQELKSLIKANGSTPGFGWYNMALSRNYLYDGQLDLAIQYLKNAEQFKEIHIGTTLGQSHYDFTATLLKIILKQKEIERIKYLNKGWWYNPANLSLIAQKTTEKYSLQFMIINQLATNPERDRVIYKLFSTESTVSFDEIWQLIDGFSTNFFLEKFKKELKNDPRPHIQRYYQFFVAKLLIKKEKYAEAKDILEALRTEKKVDQEYEKLFLARVNEALLLCYKELKQDAKMASCIAAIMEYYPSIIPFTGFTIPVTLKHNAVSPIQLQFVKALQQTNMSWVKQKNDFLVDLQFAKRGNLDIIRLSSSYKGIPIVNNIEFGYNTMQAQDIAKKLPFYIFGTGNDEKNINMNAVIKK
ncbi:MAG: hypothetical protein JNM95_03375 [Chitinophagaceae bacterium]|nr:hypothetical protein [Chitinophagaceae bacterium]